MTQFDPADGGITTEVRGRILLIGLDRPAKMNGYTPQMANQLVAAFERLDTEDDLWCGVLFGHGAHFTAGLDLPKFHAGMKEGRRSTSGRIDPMSLGRRCRKPIVTAVQGVTFTLGIELMLAGDIVVAADDCRFSQLEPMRGIHAAIQATKASSARYIREGEEACIEALSSTQAMLAATEDAAEGVAAFRERRPGSFIGR